MYESLSGTWNCILADGSIHKADLPQTLDENGIGYEDTCARQWHPDAALGSTDKAFDTADAITTRFTRKYTYEGEAKLTREINWIPQAGKRIFLEAERVRCLRLFIDGREVPHFVNPTLSTPAVFEITNLLDGGNEITLISDNSYPGLPKEEILYSSAATDETQTNWNGILGYFRLRAEEPVFVSSVQVYPHITRKTIPKTGLKSDIPSAALDVKVQISAAVPYHGTLHLKSDALEAPMSLEIHAAEGMNQITLTALPVKQDVLYWDEYEGNLYELTAALTNLGSKSVSFGIRSFGGNDEGRLALNQRTIFLRCETNCAVYPEEGHLPMELDRWMEIMSLYKSYGVNCVRFHSHCPPEAAFTAADLTGMMVQPELSHWDPKHALESEESYLYYKKELEEILRTFANHPSFVMLTLGNELHANKTGHKRMSNLLALAHRLDDTRLYANGSNVHYGQIPCDDDSDFYTACSYFQYDLRAASADMGDAKPGIKGYLNNQYPGAMTSYDEAMEQIRCDYKKPVISFEAGQYEVLPDFDELHDFHGVTVPENLRLIREKAEKHNRSDIWKNYVEATGMLALICYREEVEAAMRTEKLSGISLLGLQDFPGQGTALVGMLNSHFRPKPFPFASPDRFRAFFTNQLPLIYLPKYTYTAGELLSAEIKIANYGRHPLDGTIYYELNGHAASVTGTLPPVHCPCSKLTSVGTLRIPLDFITCPSHVDLTVRMENISNHSSIWVYPASEPRCLQSVYETRVFDTQAEAVLASGGIVFLAPDSTKESLPHSIKGQFSTDFWSVGTFPFQDGGMGQLIDASHPLFDEFPTEFHTNWQWWPMAGQRAVILPDTIQAIITEIDSYAYMRHMAQLFECRCNGGRLLFSSMGLHDLLQYPEARALLTAIYHYVESDKFLPAQEVECEVIYNLQR